MRLPPASPSSVLAFVLIVAAVCAACVAGVVVTASPGKKTRDGLLAAGALAVWLAATGALAASGILEIEQMPPRVMLYFGSLNIAALALALFPVGKRLADGLSLAALVGFHAFRLPLELVLHRWFSEGVIPEQMTYTGHNFDIVTGVSAVVLGAVLWRRENGAIAWGFNLVGTGLLLAVIVIAVRSSPIPLRSYMNDPPLLLAYAFPFTWIGSVCVAGALSAHVMLFRRLLTSSSLPSRQ